MDKLFEAVAARGHVCAGLDTAPDYIPPGERQRAPSDAAAVLAFNKALVDATIDAAACFKVQIACYEELGLAGLEAYAKTLKYIRERGGLVIADIKRGDIADTALRYAKAHFEGDFEADFVTLSPYMGMDSIEPWLSYADSAGKGAFVLMRTSNKGMRDFEYPELKISPAAESAGDSGGSAAPRRLYHVVGDKLAELAGLKRGVHGYGAFGAVVGCTEREEAAAIRERYGSLFFLIPGYGVQGGAADDAALLLREGNGGVVNASRSILKAWTAAAGSADKGAFDLNNAFAAEATRGAAVEMRNAIREAVKNRNREGKL
ncbi:MAG: orotidine-5'-phosphate decarboxylase [Treponema sp.]|nr:orotidine-5'-phosphate decarboxylase [Treponema sp.]